MNNLIWYTNNLRTQDCESLAKACKGEKAVAVYCFDPRHFEVDDYGFKRTEKFRAKFLIETVQNLKKSLEKLNISLLVFHEKPEVVLPKIVKTHHIDTIFIQKEWTRDEVLILESTKDMLPKDIKYVESYEQFLFHPEDVPYISFAQIPNVFTQFRKKCEKYCVVRPIASLSTPMHIENLVEDLTSIPTLLDLGFENFTIDSRSAFPFRGGENTALERLYYYVWQSKKLTSYKKTRNGLVGNDYSSKLSAWLANGSISARTIYHEVKKFEKEIKKNDSTYWLVFELIWRDYFKYVSLKYGDKIFWQSGILEKDYQWKTDENAKNSWIQGTTSEAFVNANMRELALTGWMSNRGRQNVASFWAKELEQDWRVGAAYFESMLIDYDVHSNWGNWMYNSGVGNDPRDRKFNIQRQAEMYDRNSTFQNLWLQQTLFSEF